MTTTLIETEVLSDVSEERNLLACVFQSQEAWLKVSDKITSEDFTHPINRSLWIAINEMREGAAIPSPVSIKDRLPSDIKTQIDSLGGWEYISALSDIPVEPLSIELHSTKLKELSILRRGQKAGAAIKVLAEK